MRNLLLLSILTISFSISAFAQSEMISDPKAEAILTKVKTMYEGYNTLYTDFVLQFEYTGEEMVSMNGALSRKGDSYKVVMPSQEFICDGKAVYVILHNNQEVQINDIPDISEEEALSPQTFFSFYESGEYAYALLGEKNFNGKTAHNIEFKPLDGDSEFFKIRLLVDKKTMQILKIKTFSKDGSRMTFVVKNQVPNKALAANVFSFDAKDFPGYYVEDFRE